MPRQGLKNYYREYNRKITTPPDTSAFRREARTSTETFLTSRTGRPAKAGRVLFAVAHGPLESHKRDSGPRPSVTTPRAGFPIMRGINRRGSVTGACAPRTRSRGRDIPVGACRSVSPRTHSATASLRQWACHEWTSRTGRPAKAGRVLFAVAHGPLESHKRDSGPRPSVTTPRAGFPIMRGINRRGSVTGACAPRTRSRGRDIPVGACRSVSPRTHSATASLRQWACHECP